MKEQDWDGILRWSTQFENVFFVGQNIVSLDSILIQINMSLQIQFCKSNKSRDIFTINISNSQQNIYSSRTKL
jgi:hypothetical protein